MGTRAARLTRVACVPYPCIYKAAFCTAHEQSCAQCKASVDGENALF